jgi:hypothetical protein
LVIPRPSAHENGRPRNSGAFAISDDPIDYWIVS